MKSDDCLEAQLFSLIFLTKSLLVFLPSLINWSFIEQVMLKAVNRSMDEVLEKCRLTIDSLRKNKKVGFLFKRIVLSVRFVSSFFILLALLKHPWSPEA